MTDEPDLFAPDPICGNCGNCFDSRVEPGSSFCEISLLTVNRDRPACKPFYVMKKVVEVSR